MFQNCCEDKCKYKVIFNVVLLESNALSWKSLKKFLRKIFAAQTFYSIRKKLCAKENRSKSTI